jgi:hypothetical protein
MQGELSGLCEERALVPAAVLAVVVRQQLQESFQAKRKRAPHSVPFVQ